jgi:hypothetical protein
MEGRFLLYASDLGFFCVASLTVVMLVRRHDWLASTAFGIILVSYRDTPQIYLYLNINQTDCCFFSLQVSKTD